MSIILQIVMLFNNVCINKALVYFLRHSTPGTMFLALGPKFVTVLFILSVVSVSEEVSPEDHVVLVAPVLAPYKSRARGSETAKDFPVLMLLATEENGGKVEETPKTKGEPSPIYVQVSTECKIILKTCEVYNAKYIERIELLVIERMNCGI